MRPATLGEQNENTKKHLWQRQKQLQLASGRDTNRASIWPRTKIRGPIGIGCNGTRDGKSSVIANADLNLQSMISLRDAISEFITEAQGAITKAEGRAQ